MKEPQTSVTHLGSGENLQFYIFSHIVEKKPTPVLILLGLVNLSVVRLGSLPPYEDSPGGGAGTIRVVASG